MQGSFAEVFEKIKEKDFPTYFQILRRWRVRGCKLATPLSSHHFWTLTVRGKRCGGLLEEWILNDRDGRTQLHELCSKLRNEKANQPQRCKIKR